MLLRIASAASAVTSYLPDAAKTSLYLASGDTAKVGVRTNFALTSSRVAWGYPEGVSEFLEGHASRVLGRTSIVVPRARSSRPACRGRRPVLLATGLLDLALQLGAACSQPNATAFDSSGFRGRRHSRHRAEIEARPRRARHGLCSGPRFVRQDRRVPRLGHRHLPSAAKPLEGRVLIWERQQGYPLRAHAPWTAGSSRGADDPSRVAARTRDAAVPAKPTACAEARRALAARVARHRLSCGRTFDSTDRWHCRDRRGFPAPRTFSPPTLWRHTASPSAISRRELNGAYRPDGIRHCFLDELLDLTAPPLGIYPLRPRRLNRR